LTRHTQRNYKQQRERRMTMTDNSEHKPQQLSINQVIDKFLTFDATHNIIEDDDWYDTQYYKLELQLTKGQRIALNQFMIDWWKFSSAQRIDEIENDGPSDYDRPPFRVGSVFN
jgi:hypothetical protein